MGQFLKIGSVWFDPERIESVTDTSPGASVPACRVRFYSGGDERFEGEHASRIMEYMKNNTDAKKFSIGV
jgi:hypothetical protein